MNVNEQTIKNNSPFLHVLLTQQIHKTQRNTTQHQQQNKTKKKTTKDTKKLIIQFKENSYHRQTTECNKIYAIQSSSSQQQYQREDDFTVASQKILQKWVFLTQLQLSFYFKLICCEIFQQFKKFSTTYMKCSTYNQFYEITSENQEALEIISKKYNRQYKLTKQTSNNVQNLHFYAQKPAFQKKYKIYKKISRASKFIENCRISNTTKKIIFKLYTQMDKIAVHKKPPQIYSFRASQKLPPKHTLATNLQHHQQFLNVGSLY
eukprot:TRINITY_DN5726_c0_g1_i2.p1 TRINITY_DN5726_c0_g1~~TRINITY_DN5726_c0_g1_i2.p1  ORF type:complete len:263 (-),score=19.27 TRINITY_DN5726_c0_g1_i2:96-884(-)